MIFSFHFWWEVSTFCQNPIIPLGMWNTIHEHLHQKHKLTLLSICLRDKYTNRRKTERISDVLQRYCYGFLRGEFYAICRLWVGFCGCLLCSIWNCLCANFVLVILCAVRLLCHFSPLPVHPMLLLLEKSSRWGGLSVCSSVCYSLFPTVKISLQRISSWFNGNLIWAIFR